MLKLTTSLFCLFSLIVTTLPSTAVAQVKEPPIASESTLQNSPGKTVPDLKLAVDQKSKEFSVQSSTFDPVKTERENANQQAQKRGMSKTSKVLLWTAVIVGVAAVIFLAVKYGKKCIRYSDYCTYDPNTGTEDCPCEEYEQEKK